MIVTQDDDGRPVDVGRGGVSRAMPGVLRRVADLRVGVEESIEGGVIRAMPVPRRVTDVGVGVKEIVKLHEVLRCFDDVSVGVEGNVAKVAEVDVWRLNRQTTRLCPSISFPRPP